MFFVEPLSLRIFSTADEYMDNEATAELSMDSPPLKKFVETTAKQKPELFNVFRKRRN